MDHLADISDARKNGVGWRRVATALLRMEASGLLAPNGQTWIRAVEAVSGYSANHLRRMTRALLSLDEIAETWPEYAGRIMGMAFSHAEILGRLWEAEREQVEALLQEKSWPTYGQLLVRYEKARARHAAPKAAGKLAANEFRSRVGMLLKRRYGNNAILYPAPYHPYCKPDFLDRHGQAAYDCVVVPGKLDFEALRRRFVSLATEASFVSEFFIVLSHNAGVEAAGACIDDLDLGNIGLMVADDFGLHDVVAPKALPVPDRRQAFRQWQSM